MYRGLDSQVVTPIENVVAFKVLGKSTTSLELDMGQYLFIMINYSARKCILYLVWNYKLVNEDVSGRGLMQECYLLITQSILYYIGCTNGCICSNDIPAGLVSICLVSTAWVNSANHSHDDKCSVHSIHRLIPHGLEVLAVVISSWWFHAGDFALVISRSINFIEYPLKNSPCFFKIFISVWHFAFHATCILFLSFLTIISFLTTTSLCTTALPP